MKTKNRAIPKTFCSRIQKRCLNTPYKISLFRNKTWTAMIGQRHLNKWPTIFEPHFD